MRVPMSWLRELLPGLRADARDVAAALIRAGLEVEKIDTPGAEVSGVVVAEVLDIEELTGFKKPIRFVQVSTGAPGARGHLRRGQLRRRRPGALRPAGGRARRRASRSGGAPPTGGSPTA